ncbi:unnamed protein product [Didymodactylos carnosus]|uniref:Protein kinase n=1 Tax=Didymodactylos carnosus TaxID=1234261 RepID=A0A8S2IPS4_9BILA|nr:unnamed protein product [Didymodactylos carnosus]CAF3771669.1 unnamed protein product [Didymodactylos carnosus]
MSTDIIPICLKFGITYQSLHINRSNANILTEIQDRALEVVRTTLPHFDTKDYNQRIKLFLISHDHVPPNLKLLTRHTDLTPACFIEIIIWTSTTDSLVLPRDHQLQEHNYKKPTYCQACNYFMWGFVKQGKRCKLCRKDYHHQCAAHLPPDCSDRPMGRRYSSTNTISSTHSNSVYVVDNDVLANQVKQKKKSPFTSLFKSKESSSHSFGSTKSSLSSTIISTFNSKSATNSNHSGASMIHSTSDKQLVNSDIPDTPSTKNQTKVPNNSRSRTSSAQTNNNGVHIVKTDRRKDIKLTNCQEKDGIWTANAQFGRESRRSKRAEIIYDRKKFQFTLKDQDGNKEVIELSAEEVEAHRARQLSDIAQTNGEVSKSRSDSITAQKNVYEKLANLLLDIINTAAQSVEHDRKARSSFKMVRSSDHNKDFADLYDMNEKEILGVGRFGMVFGGIMKKNGVPVAIKKIQTLQCSQKDRENIEQEASYLFQLNHPGILKFEGIFEFEKHIFLVTERLDTDMLNFILSNPTPKARLNEDITRFLAFQLVAAIRYLHFKNIAHCDLKPDNVLINIYNDDIIHLKVGDFGYARTIHDHSLRYTKVGTTAYLAPEVIHDQLRHARGYNKTVDMWAIGVIIFVSLTGYFPFHEDMDILPQLDNIPKLFQDEILNKVTDDVKDLLKFRLLVPDAGHRMRSAGVIYHDWFQITMN